MNSFKLYKENDEYILSVAENKLLRKEYKKQSLTRVRQEFLFYKTAENKNIPRVYEYGINEHPYIIMDFIDGARLSDTLLNEDETEHLFFHISSTIAHIHTYGICLNNLKPNSFIIKNKLPYLIDFSEASLNLTNHSEEKFNLAFISPEKLSRNSNHFASDIFSLGLLYLFCKNKKTILDEYETDTYQSLLTNEELLEKSVNKLTQNNFIKRMLNTIPLKRPSGTEVFEYFCNKTKQTDPRFQELFIKSYLFKCQEQAFKKLWKTKTLKYEFFDEPQKIEYLLALKLENQQQKLQILDEKQFVYKPEDFFKSFPQGYRDNKMYHHKLIEFFKDQNYRILLKRSENISPTDLFNSLEIEFDCFVLTESKHSELKKISNKEITELSAKIKIIPANIKPFQLRLLLLQNLSKKYKKDTYNEIYSFINWLGMDLPVSVAEILWENCFSLLQEGLLSRFLIIEGDYIKCASNNKDKKPDSRTLEIILEKLKQTSFFNILGKMYFLNNDTNKAMQYWNNHLEYLIQQQYFLSAYEFLNVISQQIKLSLFTFEIKKKFAFISRITGKFQESKKLYEQLIKETSDIPKAVILCDFAIVLQALNQHNEAINIYKDAIELFKLHKDWKSLFRAMNNLGVVYFDLKRYTEAESLFNDVLLQAKILKNIQFETISYLNLADIYCKRGEWNKAVFHCDKAIFIAENNNKWNLVSNGKIIKARSIFAQGDFVQATNILEYLLNLSQTKENQLLMHEILAWLIHFYQKTYSGKTEELLSVWNLPSDDMHEILVRELFFYYYFSKSYLNAYKMLEKIPENIILPAFLNSDNSVIEERLKELKIQNEHDSYLYYLTHYLRSDIPDRNSAQIENYYDDIKLFSFKPAEFFNTATDCSFISELLRKMDAVSEPLECIKIIILEISIHLRLIYFDNQLCPVFEVDKFNINDSPTNISYSNHLLKQAYNQKGFIFEDNLLNSETFSINADIIASGINSILSYSFYIEDSFYGLAYSEINAQTKLNNSQLELTQTLFQLANVYLENRFFKQDRLEKNDMISLTNESNKHWELIGNSKVMEDVYNKVKMVAKHNVNVLITGETGVGKELVSKAIHNLYTYKEKAPFVAVNCAAIPEQLLESELFGYRKGAFTGAVGDQKGKILEANNGTLFLDEIGELPLILQAKFLRVLQEKYVTPLGSSENIPVSVRIITATNRNLEEMVQKNLFRADLFYRLKVVTILIPSLAERREDIPLLVMHFLKKFNHKFDKNIQGIQPNTMRYLQSKEWKGNIRELENEMERAVLMCHKDYLSMDDLIENNIEENKQNEIINIPLQWKDYKQYKQNICNDLDKKFVTQLLSQADNNVSLASKIGHLERIQIYRLLKNYNEDN